MRFIVIALFLATASVSGIACGQGDVAWRADGMRHIGVMLTDVRVGETLEREPSASLLSSSYIKKSAGTIDYRQLLWYRSSAYSDDQKAIEAGEAISYPISSLQLHEDFIQLSSIRDAEWDDECVVGLRLTQPWGSVTNLAKLPRLRILLLASGPFDLADYPPDHPGRLTFPDSRIGGLEATLAYVTPDLIALKLPAGVRMDEHRWKQLSRFRELQALSLWDTKTEPANLHHLQQLALLKVLDLDGTATNDEDMEALGRIPSLEAISLNGTLVTDEGLQHLAGCPKLFELRLVNTQVTDAGVRRLKQSLPSLRFVELIERRPIDLDKPE